MSRRGARVAALALAIVSTGCGQADTLADRYRAERSLWWAQRAETAANLGGQKPDSATLLLLREEYLRVGKGIRHPFVRGSGERARRLGEDLIRVVGFADLQAARLAVQANRPELALEEMTRVAEAADADTALRRQADFFRVGTLRQYRRFDEAVELLRGMLGRYEPTVPAKFGDEDPILAAPEAIVRLTREKGDSAGAKLELKAARRYYSGLLERSLPAALEAQVLARLVRVDLELSSWDDAARNLERLDRIVGATPFLSPLEPEVRYSRAKIRSIRDKSPAAAAAMLDALAREFPESPYAALALFDAGVLLERQGKRGEALARYRVVGTRYASQMPVAPTAVFRRAMLEEQTGNWEDAKNLLESIPVRYPDTQAAVEAPTAIAQRYIRVGDRNGAILALKRAVGTYEALIGRDTTSTFCPVYRASILRCQLTVDDWAGALATIDAMAAKDAGHPFTAQALLEGGRLAKAHGQKDRARLYLEEFLAEYPKSPLVAEVKRDLAQLGGKPKSGGAN